MARPRKFDTDRGDLQAQLINSLTNPTASMNPRLLELSEALFKEFKGAEGLASWMHSEFMAATAGGTTRERILGMMINLVTANQKLGLHTDVDPSVLTDEQLADLTEQVGHDAG